MRKKSIILTAVILVIFTSTVFARMGGKGRMSRGSYMMGEKGGMHTLSFCIANADEIGLSDEQLAKIKSLKYELEKKQITLNAEKDLIELELDQLLNMESLDLKAIEEGLRKKYDIKIQLTLETLRVRQEVKGLLSEKQVNTLKELMNKKKIERMKEGMGGSIKNKMMKKMLEKGMQSDGGSDTGG